MNIKEKRFIEDMKIKRRHRLARESEEAACVNHTVPPSFTTEKGHLSLQLITAERQGIHTRTHARALAQARARSL